MSTLCLYLSLGNMSFDSSQKIKMLLPIAADIAWWHIEQKVNANLKFF